VAGEPREEDQGFVAVELDVDPQLVVLVVLVVLKLRQDPPRREVGTDEQAPEGEQWSESTAATTAGFLDGTRVKVWVELREQFSIVKHDFAQVFPEQDLYAALALRDSFLLEFGELLLHWGGPTRGRHKGKEHGPWLEAFIHVGYVPFDL